MAEPPLGPSAPYASPEQSRLATLSAALIAAITWAGLVLNVVSSFSHTGSLVVSVWTLLRFFTITTNVLIAVLFTGIAAHDIRCAEPRRVAPLALAILLVGIVYKLLLEGLSVLNGSAQVADVLLHRVTPVLVPLFWLTVTPKGRLRSADPALWALYPLGYFVYALARAHFGDPYPYPFMDVGKIGWHLTGINAVVIALGFMATGLAMVWLDRMLGRRVRG